MGLDTVELLVDIEKIFNIEIPDLEAETINTVQDFVDSVFDKLDVKSSKHCLSQKLFYKIRKSLVTLNNKKENIKVNSELSNFLLPQNL